MARTEAGYWMAVEPVDVRIVETPTDLQRVLLTTIKRGNPRVPTPDRDNFPRPVMERHCGLKSLSAFERAATLWAISGDSAEYRIYEWRRTQKHMRGREKAVETEVKLLPDAPVEYVALRAAELAMAIGTRA
jgi:hypothetical protein